MKLLKSIALAAALVLGVVAPDSARAALIYSHFTIPENSPNVGEFHINTSGLWQISQLSPSGPWDFRYAYQAFRTSVSGVYTMGMTDGVYDAMMILYTGTTTFPADPSSGATALVDDGAWDYNSQTGLYYFDTQTVNPLAVPNGYGSYYPSWLPMIKEQTLAADTDYLIVISSFSAQTKNGESYSPLGSLGTFNLPSSFFIGGPAAVTLYGAEPAAVPEPGTWAAAALLLGGAGFARWRKRKA